MNLSSLFSSTRHNDFWIDNTRVKDFLTCERRYWLRHMATFKKTGAYYAAFQVGSALHKAWETFLLTSNLDLALREIDTCEINSIKIAHSKANLKNIFRQWSNKVYFDFVALYSVERPLYRTLCPGIDYLALIDLTLYHDDQIIPLDHKTMSTLSEQEHNSSQLMGYCWTVGSNFAYVNSAEIGLLPVGRKQCITHKVAKNECQSLHFKHNLYQVNFTKKQLELWHTMAVACGQAIQATHQKTYDQTIPNITRCKSCVYRSICYDGDYAGFVFEPWNPTQC